MIEKIQQAVHILKTGEVIAFPTDTVYGIGADPFNSEAVQKLFIYKGRCLLYTSPSPRDS